MDDLQPKSQDELDRELGKLSRRAVWALTSIEAQHAKLGPERSREDVRARAIGSLQLLILTMRDSMRLEATYNADAADDILNTLAIASFPSPLFILMIELAELQHKRRSPLFSKPDDDIGEGHHHFARVQAKALAAAVLDVLVERRLTDTKTAASELVADTLNKNKFANPTGKPYEGRVVREWWRGRDKKQDGFAESFKRHRLELRDNARRAEALGISQRDVRSVILYRLAMYLNAVSYR